MSMNVDIDNLIAVLKFANAEYERLGETARTSVGANALPPRPTTASRAH